MERKSIIGRTEISAKKKSNIVGGIVSEKNILQQQKTAKNQAGNAIISSIFKLENGKLPDANTISKRMGYKDAEDLKQYEENNSEVFAAMGGIKPATAPIVNNDLQKIATERIISRYNNTNQDEINNIINALDSGDWINADTMKNYSEKINSYVDDRIALSQLGYLNFTSEDEQNNVVGRLKILKDYVNNRKDIFSRFENSKEYSKAIWTEKYGSMTWEELNAAERELREGLLRKNTDGNNTLSQELEWLNKLLNSQNKDVWNAFVDYKSATKDEQMEMLSKVKYGVSDYDNAKGYIEILKSTTNENDWENTDEYISFVKDWYSKNGNTTGARQAYGISKGYVDENGYYNEKKEKNTAWLNFAETIAYYEAVYGSKDNLDKLHEKMTEYHETVSTNEEFVKYYNEMQNDPMANLYIGKGKKIYDKKNKNISDKEYEIVCYYLGKDGNSNNYYFTWLEDVVYKREVAANKGWTAVTDGESLKYHRLWSDYTKDAPLEANALSVVLNLGSGAELVYNTLNGDIKESKLSKASSKIREAYSNTHDGEFLGIDHDLWYNTGMSIVDSLASRAVGGPYALAFSAAASGVNDALDRGVSGPQALLNGIANGINEYIFESISFGQLDELMASKGAGFKTFLKNLLNSGFTNWGEETLTEASNFLYDRVFNGDLSHYALNVQQYVDNGYTEEQAKKQTLNDLKKQIEDAGVSGLLMGLFFGVIGGSSAQINASIYGNNKYGSSATGINALVENGLAMPEGSAAYKLAVKADTKLKSGKNLSGTALYNLATAIESEIESKSQARLIELGVDKKSVKELAPVMAKSVFGERLTSQQSNMINSNETAKQIVQELSSDRANTIWKNAIKQNKTQTILSSYMKPENMQALINEGINMPKNSLAHTLALQYQDKINSGNSLSETEIIQLVKANEQAFKTEDISKITSAAKSRLNLLGETSDASKLASIIVKKALGQRLTTSEKNILNNSKYGQRVYNELNLKNVISEKYASDWARNIDVERIGNNIYNSQLNLDNNNDTINTVGEKYVKDYQRNVGQIEQEHQDKNTGRNEKTKENGRIRQEDNVAFRRRIAENFGAAGRFDFHLNSTIAYKVVEEIDVYSQAGITYNILKSKGYNVVYCDGVILINNGKYTIEQTEAITLSDGTVYISNLATLDGVGIALHEVVHVWQYAKTKEYYDYESVLCEEINTTSNIYRSLANKINDNHYNGKYDIDDINSFKYIIKELSAYINQYTISNPQYAQETFEELFFCWENVVKAVYELNGKLGFNDALENGGENNVANDYGRTFENNKEFRKVNYGTNVKTEGVGSENKITFKGRVDEIYGRNRRTVSHVNETVSNEENFDDDVIQKAASNDEVAFSFAKTQSAQGIDENAVIDGMWGEDETQSNLQLNLDNNNDTINTVGENNESTNTKLLDRGTISTSYRGDDILRKQSFNSRTLATCLGISSESDAALYKTIWAGESSWVDGRTNTSSEKAWQGYTESIYRKIRGVKLSGKDTIGGIVSPKILSRFKDTVCKDENGNLLSLYHCTTEIFDVFTKGEFGFHFGTLKAAHERYLQLKEENHYISKAIYKEVILNVTNPIELSDDSLEWNAGWVAIQLLQKGIINDYEYAKLQYIPDITENTYDNLAARAVREILSQNGYDGIIYKNQSEDIGSYSIIALYPEQIITVAENGILKKNSGINRATSNDEAAFSFAKTQSAQGIDENAVIDGMWDEKTSPNNSQLRMNENNDIIKNENNYTDEDCKAAVLRYKSGESYIINAKLRESHELNEFQYEFVNTLDAALQQLPTYKGRVYRNVVFDDIGDENVYRSFLKRHIIGDRISYEQYLSCSKVQDGYPVEGKLKVHFVIESENARDVDGFGNNMESEVIFARDTFFVVKNIDLNTEYPIIYLQEEEANDRYNAYDNDKSRTAVRNLQASYTVHGDLQGISGQNTERDIERGLRPQSAVSKRQWGTVRGGGRNETVLPAVREEHKTGEAGIRDSDRWDGFKDKNAQGEIRGLQEVNGASEPNFREKGTELSGYGNQGNNRRLNTLYNKKATSSDEAAFSFVKRQSAQGIDENAVINGMWGEDEAQSNLQLNLDNNNDTINTVGENYGSENSELLEKRRISATGGSGNILWQQGTNSAKLAACLEILQGVNRPYSKRVWAGESGWLNERTHAQRENREGFARRIFGKIRGIKLSGKDTIGGTVSPEILEKFKDTVFKDENGNLISLWHWTAENFEEFAKGEFGFHFGTLQAAHDRYLRLKEDNPDTPIGNYKEVICNIINPIEMNEGVGEWNAHWVAIQLLQKGIINDYEYAKLQDIPDITENTYDNPAAEAVREILSKNGYDGIIYKNQSEDIGSYSIIALYPEQIITVAENGVLKENSGINRAISNDEVAFSFAKTQSAQGVDENAVIDGMLGEDEAQSNLQLNLDNNNDTINTVGENYGSENSELLEKRRISATGGSGNILWKQGTNSEKLATWMGVSQRSDATTTQTVRVGESGWIRGRLYAQRKDSEGFKQSIFRKIRGVSLSGKDTIGGIVNQDIIEKFKHTICKDENGNLLSLYHWTNKIFAVFTEGEFGFHFGTLQAAHDRYLQLKEENPNISKGVYKEVILNITNPIELSDDNLQWTADWVAFQLLQKGIINEYEYNTLQKMSGINDISYDNPAAEAVREILSKNGYDGIIYKNQSEDIGSYSIIALYPEQIITVAENGILKKNSGINRATSNDEVAFSAAIGKRRNAEDNAKYKPSNIGIEDYDKFFFKKPIKVSKKEWAKVNSARTQKYLQYSEESIPDVDFFRIAEYNEINVAYRYYVRNYDNQSFEIISKVKIKEVHNNARTTYTNTDTNGLRHGIDGSGSGFTEYEQSIRNNDELVETGEQSNARRTVDNGGSDSRREIDYNIITKATSNDEVAFSMPIGKRRSSSNNIIELSKDNELFKRIGNLRGAEKYKVIQQYILEVLGGEEIVLSDGKVAVVDKSDALHIANKAANKKTAQISEIKKLIEKAKLVAEEESTKGRKFDYFYYYATTVKYDGEIFNIYLDVGRASNDGTFHIYDITNKIRDTANRINGLERPKPNEGYALTNGISNNIITNLKHNVNNNSLTQTDKFNDVQELNSDEVKYIKNICRRLGVEVLFEDLRNIKDKDGNIISPDGYVGKDGVIHLNIYAENPIGFVFKHELTHFAERSQNYKEFVRQIKKSTLYKNWLKQKTNESNVKIAEYVYKKQVVASQNNINSVQNPKAEAEMIADFTGDMLFTDNGSGMLALTAELDTKPRNAVVRFITDFISWIKKKISGIKSLTLELSILEDSFNKLLSDAKKIGVYDGAVMFRFGGSRGAEKLYNTLEASKPENDQEWSEFNRQFANKTSDLKNGKQKNIIICTEKNVYFVSASGYMAGCIEGKMHIDGNEDIINKMIKEYSNGTFAIGKIFSSSVEGKRREYRRGDRDSVGTEGRDGQSENLNLDERQSKSNDVGYNWENYGYKTWEELIDAIDSGALIMDDNGNILTFEKDKHIKATSNDEVAFSIPIGKRKNAATEISLRERSSIKDICRRLGVEVLFEDLRNIKDKDGNIISPDGYVGKDGVIHLNIYAENPIGFVFKHELTHFAERSQNYKEFVRQIKKSTLYKNWLKQKTNESNVKIAEYVYKKQVVASQNNINSVQNPKAEAEMIADFTGDMLFTDNGSGMLALTAELDTKPRNAVVRFITDFISWLKKKFVNGQSYMTYQLSVLEDGFNRLLSDVTQMERDGKYGYNNEIKFSMAGKNSKTANYSLLFEAKLRAYKGEDSETIRKDTGWYKGRDGKWRYYIPDNELNIDRLIEFANSDESVASLGDVITHNKLFAAYPELKDINVKFKKLGDSNYGEYLPALNEIHLDYKLLTNNELLKDILIHEIQHAIQIIEDFSMGGNERIGYSYAINTAFEIIKNSEEFKNLGTKEEKLDYIHKIAQKLFNAKGVDELAYNAYLNIYGEVEARQSAKYRNYDEKILSLVSPDTSGIIINNILEKNNAVENLVEIGYTETEARKIIKEVGKSDDQQRRVERYSKGNSDSLQGLRYNAGRVGVRLGSRISNRRFGRLHAQRGPYQRIESTYKENERSSGNMGSTIRTEIPSHAWSKLARGMEDNVIREQTATSNDEVAFSIPIGKRKNAATEISLRERSSIKDICRRLGVEVLFEDLRNIKDKDGNIISPDGYVGKDGVIHLNIYAENPIGFVFKHELTHFAERSQNYKEFVRQIKKSTLYKNWLKQKTNESNVKIAEYVYKKQVVASQNNINSVQNPKAEAEMIADFTGDMLFTDNGSGMLALTAELDTKPRNAVVRFITDFISWLKKKFVNGQSYMTYQLSVLEDGFNRLLSEAVQTNNIYGFNTNTKSQQLQAEENNDIIENENTSKGDSYVTEEQLRNSSTWGQFEGENTQNRTRGLQENDGRIFGNRQENFKRFNGTEVVSNQGYNRGIKLSDKRAQNLKTTAIKNEDGTPKTVYHFTSDMNFEIFAKGDIGFHFGNESQAKQRGVNLKQQGRIISAHLDIRNPIYINTDLMSWYPAHVAVKLYADGIITNEQYLLIRELHIESGYEYNSPAAVKLREILSDLGYDGIVYENHYEGIGKSYIAFYPEQIITVDDGKTNKSKAASNDEAASSMQQNSDDVSYCFTRCFDEELINAAEEMESDGFDSYSIWKELNVLRGIFGDWEQEIDINGFKFFPNGNATTGSHTPNPNLKQYNGMTEGVLSDFVYWNELYEKYPRFKNIRVIIRNASFSYDTARFILLEQQPTLFIDKKLCDAYAQGKSLELKALVLRELQRIIQYREGRYTGKSLDYWKNLERRGKLPFSQKLGRQLTAEDMMKYFVDNYEAELVAQRQRVKDVLKKAQEKIGNINDMVAFMPMIDPDEAITYNDRNKLVTVKESDSQSRWRNFDNHIKIRYKERYQDGVATNETSAEYADSSESAQTDYKNKVIETGENARQIHNFVVSSEKRSNRQDEVRRSGIIKGGNSGFAEKSVSQKYTSRQRYDEQLYGEYADVPIADCDTIGRGLGDTVRATLSGTAAKNENGEPLSFYVVNQYGDNLFKHAQLGLIVGTVNMAVEKYNHENELRNTLRKGFCEEYYAKIKKPLYLPFEPYQLSVDEIGFYMVEQGLMTRSEYQKLIETKSAERGTRYDSNMARKLRERLKSAGYDSLVFENQNYDAGSMSVVVFDAEQLIPVAKNGILIEGNGITDVEQSFDPVRDMTDVQKENKNPDKLDWFLGESKYRRRRKIPKPDTRIKAGSSGWMEKQSSDPDVAEEQLYQDLERAYQTESSGCDAAGRGFSRNLKKETDSTVFKAHDGDLLSFFVWGFDVSDVDKLVKSGTQFKTFDSAFNDFVTNKQRYPSGINGLFKEIYINSVSPLIVRQNGWNTASIADMLFENGKISQKYYSKLMDMAAINKPTYNNAAAKNLREQIKLLGYDSIIFINENGEKSVTVFDPSQIICVSTNGILEQDGNITQTDEIARDSERENYKVAGAVIKYDTSAAIDIKKVESDVLSRTDNTAKLKLLTEYLECAKDMDSDSQTANVGYSGLLERGKANIWSALARFNALIGDSARQIPISTLDTANRHIAEKIRQIYKDTVLKDSNGRLLSFFVWNKYGEYRSNHTAFLYNLGTLVAAHDAYLAEKQKHNYLTGGRYEEYIVNATSPYFMTDTTGEFSPKAIAADMHKNGVFTRIEYKDIVLREGAEISDRDSNAAKYLRQKIQEKGYDSIIYMNEKADPGSMGVIVLDPSQLTLVSIDGKLTDENISLENIEESGYNVMYRKGSTHRRVSDDNTYIIDKPTYHKITNPIIKQGADIRLANNEWLEHLRTQNATAVTIGDVIYFREDATVSDVLEETYHFLQNKKCLNDQYDNKQRTILNEIDAKEYVLSMSEKYHIPKDEVELTKQQLAYYKLQLERLKEREESDD